MRLASLGMFALLAILAWTPAASGQSLVVPKVGLTPEEVEYLRSHGPIRFVTTNFPPWTLTNSAGDPAGIGFDLIHLMEVKVGFAFDVTFVGNVTDMLAMIRDGRADAWPASGYSPERAKEFWLSEPFAENAVMAWGPASSTALEAEGFTGARVAVTRASTQVPVLLETYPRAVPVYVGNHVEGVKAVANGSVDAFLGLLPSIAYNIRLHGYTDLVPLDGILGKVTMHFAASNQEPLLTSILAKGLSVVSPSERVAIFLKWTGQDLSERLAVGPTPFPWVVAARVAGGAVFATAIIAVPLWIAVLRRQVRGRTAEVTASNTQLERKVGERTADLEAFSFAVSHELRAPLRAVSGYAKLLLEDELPAGGQATQHAREVAQGAHDMGLLIDDFLAFTRVGRARLKAENVAADDIVRDVVDSLRSEQPDHPVRVQVDPLPPARGDPLLLRQVWYNLLENAFKYTRPKPKPEIHVFARTHPDTGFVTYTVEDTGVGFDPAYTGKLYGAFQRLHRVEDFPGTGLGLALVKKIVESHGGTVAAHGVLGQGARFSFSLPGEKP